MKHDDTPEAVRYVQNLYAPEDTVLKEIAKQFEERGLPIQIGPEEARLLQVLIVMSEVKTIVEIGTLGGYSAIWMARALPSNGQIITIDNDPEHAVIARHNIAASDVTDKIELREGEASTVLEEIAIEGPFDMAFIDADKINYPNYLDWTETHIRKKGLIAADNTFLFGAVYQDEPPEGTAPTTWHAMRAFNERLADQKKYCSVIIPTVEGLSIAVKMF